MNALITEDIKPTKVIGFDLFLNKGSNNATKPSEAEKLVFTAEWAIEADPAPASFEKAALLKPVIKTPTIPPTPAEGLKACLNIIPNASST